MRWTPKEGPEEGELRTYKRFALFPVRLSNGDKVWLEQYTVTERFEWWTDKNGRFYITNEIRPAWVVISIE